MKHIHHIVPRHAGGTDEPDNLIELTVEEHARAHYLLWNEYGRWQDEVAWKSLYGMIGQEEIMLTVQTKAAQEAWQNPLYRERISQSRKEMWRDPKYKERFSQSLKERWKDPKYRDGRIAKMKDYKHLAITAALSPESQQKRKETFKQIKHQQGPNNSQFGKMWITNGSHSYKINKNDPIPEGCRKGRVIKVI